MHAQGVVSVSSKTFQQIAPVKCACCYDKHDTEAHQDDLVEHEGHRSAAKQAKIESVDEIGDW